MDDLDEYQEWLHLTWGYGVEGGEIGMNLEDKYRGMTEEERDEERRKMEAWNERRERAPGSAAPLCGAEPEINAFKA